MSIDFDAIARAEHCDATQLRNAMPLLEQGYLPPFLARYRRDELGGLSEATLWALRDAVRQQARLNARRQDLQQRWERTAIGDSAIKHAIQNAESLCVLERLNRHLRGEPTEKPSPAMVLAARVLSPEPDDPADPEALAARLVPEEAQAAIQGLDKALTERLTNDPRIIYRGVRWLENNAKIRIEKITDPTARESTPPDEQQADAKPPADKPSEPEPQPTELSLGSSPQSESADGTSQSPTPETATVESSMPETAAVETPLTETTVAAKDATTGTETDGQAAAGQTAEQGGDRSIQSPAAELNPDDPLAQYPAVSAKEKKQKGTSASQTIALTGGKKKKVSARQKRRQWLAGVLQPLAGKSFTSGKLTSFQKLMLGRALRGQLTQCSFEYRADVLTSYLQNFAAKLNSQLGPRLQAIVAANEQVIRQTCESAWWDEVLDQAATRLVSILASHLRKQVLRQSVDARVVMSIDAIGPQTVALAIVAADGTLLASEDLPCQLSPAARQQTVTRLGELVHRYHVDLIVVSNGPVRRSMLILLNELLEQSQPGSVRWSLAERSGADLYAGSPIGNREMPETPRRFRAATWLAFQVLAPAQALTKVDPARLRLGSYQRELSDDALADALSSILVSSASSDGVDVNKVDVSWLARLPGMNAALAEQIVELREGGKLQSRDDLEALPWPLAVDRNQALPFLRVFGSSNTLDGTLIHPHDYLLAEKLMNALEIPAPPAYPPGYVAPEKPSPTTDAVVPPSDPTSPEASPASNHPESQTADGQTADGQTAEVHDGSGEGGAGDPADALAGEDIDLPLEGFQPKKTPAEPEESVISPPVVEPYRHPFPENQEMDRRIKEWQVGRQRAKQIVHWLCDPFSRGPVASEPATAAMERIPKLSNLQPGTKVAGIVVSVAGFGVFVELGPDCNGLIHVSRLSERFVEDMNEVVQVGDVIVAWVQEVDLKRRRVALSAIPPERQAQMDRNRGGSRYRDSGRGARGRSGRGDGGQQHKDAQGQSVGKTNQRFGAGEKGKGQRPQSDQRGVRGRGRGRDRRENRDDKPRVYTKVAAAKPPAAPISEAMVRGDEPLRSFGDLAQFFQKKSTPDTAKSETAPPSVDAVVDQTTPTPVVQPVDSGASSGPKRDDAPEPQPSSTGDQSQASAPGAIPEQDGTPQSDQNRESAS